jgi:D-3-phosphoglycerate dehydrogenase
VKFESETMNITVLDDYQNVVRTLDAYKLVAGHDVTIWNDHTKDVDVLAGRLKDTEALVLIRERTPIREALIERLPKLRIVSQRSVYPHIDVDALTRRCIVLSSDMHPGKPSYATAELTWGLVIAAMRRIPQEVAALKAGRWQSSLGTGLRGRSLGIYGYGRIGAAVAGYGRAFGMNVTAFGREGSADRARKDGIAVATSREAFFEDSDVVSLHLRLRPETRGIVTAEDLARMKPTALIVNTSRAGLIAPGVLVDALEKGRPGLAAVDVYEDEPVLNASHPLVHMDNVVATPHIGYVERDGYESQFASSFGQIAAFAAGKPINVINPEALGRSKE